MLRRASGAEAEALRYLRDLGWEALYRRPVGAGPAGSPGAEMALSGEGNGPQSSVSSPEALEEATRTAGPAVPPARPPAPGAVPDPGADAPASPSAQSWSAEERARLLAEVGAEALRCERCELARGRIQVVFGSGHADAELMVIGEGPGAQEDRQGLPFVGPAGELLTRILRAIGLERDQVYIANIVKCRPPRNRDPLPAEVAACRPWLERQIELVRPRVIVALGRVAGQTLLGNDFPVGRLRGSWWEVRGVPVRVTYHPAALLRDARLKRPTWEDMKLVRERLAGTASA